MSQERHLITYKTGAKGYSLTEILLAILIFATTLTPLIQLFIQSTREAESAVDYYKASNYLAMEIERLRSLIAIQPKAFSLLYPADCVIDKKIEKFDIKVKIYPGRLISTVSAYSGHKIDSQVTEVEAEAVWKSNSGRSQKFSFNTSL